MTLPSVHDANGPTHSADDVVALVREWLVRARRHPIKGSEKTLAGLLGQPGGLAFLTEFVDGVMRPEDHQVAARAFGRIGSRHLPFLPVYLRVSMRMGAWLSPVVPRQVVQIARRTVRAVVSHLVVDAAPERLGGALSRIRARGHLVNVHLLGEAVLGHKASARRIERVIALIARADVDYVSITVSGTVARRQPWAFDTNVRHVVETLRPLYRSAMGNGRTFLNLDMEKSCDVDLTIDVFTRILDEPEFLGLTAGIALQAYLPDSAEALERIELWAAARCNRGGAPIKVRLVKGANLPMERVDAEIHGWPLATWGSKVETDAHFKRLLNAALTPERTKHVHIGVAGHNLFDIAHAWLTATERGVTDAVDFEMLLGMGEHVAATVADDVGALRMYTPVVHGREFDVALAYVVRRLEEVASAENFMSSLYTLDERLDVFDREKARFLAAWDLASTPTIATHRTQPSAASDTQPLFPPDATFANTPDTDPSVPSRRAWAAATADRAASSSLGRDTLRSARVDDSGTLDAVVGEARAGGERWSRVSAGARARILRAVAAGLEASRSDLIEVLMSDAAQTMDQADPEVSAAVDFALYYADRCEELESYVGVYPVARALTLVTPPRNVPVAIPAASTLAALAAGSGVILKPAQQTARCGAVLAEVMWDEGVPRDALTLVDIDIDPANDPECLGDWLIRDTRIDQVILTGAYETAENFLTLRPGLRLLAETSGKNAIVVTPSADMDLAVRDVVASAFGHAGQRCSAASLVILVGSVATSRRFLEQLEDAVASLVPGLADDLSTQIGPLVGAVGPTLQRALTVLEPGETWMVEPTRWGTSDSQWNPGVRAGVAPGSFFHLTECRGPVLGIMRAATLDEAIQHQNSVPYGLTAGLHSLDEQEMAIWLDHVQAGNLYVNRATTGAMVQRQPFGGWKKSAVGPTFKAGGPHYLLALTDWARTEDAGVKGLGVPVARRASQVIEVSQAPEWVRDAAAADEAEWQRVFGTAVDRTGLVSEANLLRYLPSSADVRWDGDAPLLDLIRVFAAGLRAGGRAIVSVSGSFPPELGQAILGLGLEVRVESWDTCMTRLAKRPGGGRVRLVGRVEGWYDAAKVALFAGPVTSNPTLELLPFLREQSVAISTHRYGAPFQPALRVAAALSRPAE